MDPHRGFDCEVELKLDVAREDVERRQTLPLLQELSVGGPTQKIVRSLNCDTPRLDLFDRASERNESAPFRLATRSKRECGFEPITDRASRPHGPDPLCVDPDATLDELFATLLTTRIAQAIECARDLQAASSAESLHRLKAAIRRLIWR